MASLLTERPVKNYLAMTGEITLKGNVLPVGGIKEKALAAARAGIREIILPERNIADLEQLPEEVRRKIRFHPVKTMAEVLKIALENDEKGERTKPDRKKSSARPESVAGKPAVRKRSTK
jgi:ATP-dependent Lon protease